MTATPVSAWSIEPGRYICLRTRSLYGRLIRLLTSSPFDHVVVVTGPDEIVQATVWGVRRGSLSQFAGNLAVCNAAEPMTAHQRAAVVTAVGSYAGDEYAWAGIVVIGLRKLGLRWAWLLKASADRDAVFCSELAALGGGAAGLDWDCGEASPALVTPAEMAARGPFMVLVSWAP